VIIKSFEGVPAVDADSILFLENRLGFGKVRLITIVNLYSKSRILLHSIANLISTGFFYQF
jgi:hypothetical protein